MTVHLVNLTNPMMMKGPLRETIPIGPQRVRVRLPAQARARRVRLLTAGTSPRVEQSGDLLTLTVPSVDVHEVVAIDLWHRPANRQQPLVAQAFRPANGRREQPRRAALP